MVIDSKKIDKKYLNTLIDRVGRMAWDMVIAGSSLKVKESLQRTFHEIIEIRKMMIEQGILILDKDLLPVSKWPAKVKKELGIED